MVDLDVHDGDGTRSLFAADPTVHTFSIHNATSGDGEAVEATAIELGYGVGDAAYLEAVRTRLPPVLAAFQPGAGLLSRGSAIRRRTTRSATGRSRPRACWSATASCLSAPARASGRLPLVVVLAGGYGLNAWRYSARFLSSLLNRGRAVEPPTTEEALLSRYRRLARELEPARADRRRRSGRTTGGSPPRTSRPRWAAPTGRAASSATTPARGWSWPWSAPASSTGCGPWASSSPTLEMDLDNPTGDTVRLYGDPPGASC